MAQKPRFDKEVLDAIDLLIKNGIISKTTKGEGNKRINVMREVSFALQKVYDAKLDVQRITDYIVKHKKNFKEAPSASLLIRKHDSVNSVVKIGNSTEARKAIDAIVKFANKKTNSDFLRARRVQAQMIHQAFDKEHRAIVGPPIKPRKGRNPKR